MTEKTDHPFSILIIQTGGTIDKNYPKRAGAYAFEIGSPASQEIVDAAYPSIKIEYGSVFRKDSQEINQQDRELLYEVCKAAIQSSIVITHGTDTLLETAVYLGNKALKKTIILTGSFRPATFKNSDANFNLGVALGALQCISTYGVYVAMNCQVFQWNQVTRNLDTGNFIAKL
ncbi:probable L-asparaginase periplasmic [Antedon mediterranea]|uniref:probable L-asparaginase periplasmic n=1 Tax=Antedon mediterranea TaxID=105859 RepID=UPI003AF977BB